MARHHINAKETASPTDQTVTSTSLNNKTGLDSAILADNSAQTALKLAIDVLETALDGTLPRSVYDSMTTVVVGATYTFRFKYSDISQFVITVTDPVTAPAYTIQEINNLLLEGSSGVRLLEDGSERLLEG